MLNKLRISVKLPLVILLASAVSCLSIGFVSYNIGSSALEYKAKEELRAILASRKASLEHYLSSIHSDITFVATNKETINATKEFIDAWGIIPMERGAGVAQKDYLQHHYIKENPNPLGEKEKLDAANDGTSYSRVHADHHPWFRQFLNERGYYDIFLFDLNGDLVYTVFKELDYATNLNRGEYKNSDLGNAFRAAADPSAKAGDAFFFDFKPYAPSHGAPAAFISTPIFDKGRKVGVLAFQMPIARLNNTLSIYDGLGETGETYAVGSDKLMRTDSRFSEESTILKKTVDSLSVENAIAGEKGIHIIDDYRGISVFSAYDIIDFLGTRWAIIAEQDEEEIMARAHQMSRDMILLTLLVLVFVGAIGWLISRSISKPIVRISDTLRDIAEGKDVEEIAGAERSDEVGDLAKAATVFKENAEQAKRMQEQQREAEIRAEQEKKQAMLQMADDFESEVKGIVQMVAAAATQLAQTAEGVAVSIGQSSQTSAEAASAAEQTSSNVQSVASAAEELSASVQEISTQIIRSNQMVHESVSKTENADKQALSLSEATQRVKEVVELISDIAGKINLLSLNATIESARAGEAGKGFAVVASEVKNLANQTDRSIEEIVKVINDMNLASDNIISSLNEIKSSINSISESSGSVASAVEEQSATTNEIAKNMQTAAQGTDLIRDNLRTVNMGCAEADESARQILQASQELSQQSEMLNIKLDNFINKIREG